MKEVSRKRQQRFAKIEEAKEFRKLIVEYNDTYYRKWGTSYIELDEPLFYGYKKFWVLREDWARSPQAGVLRKVLDQVNQVIHSKKKTFLRRDYKTKKYYEENPGFRSLTEKQYEALPTNVQRYFYKCSKRSFWGVEYFEYNLIQNKGYFVTKVDKNFLTKVPRLDPDAQSRGQELHDKMWHSMAYRRNLKTTIGNPYRWVFPDKGYDRDYREYKEVVREKDRKKDFKAELEDHRDQTNEHWFCHGCKDWVYYEPCYDCYYCKEGHEIEELYWEQYVK